MICLERMVDPLCCTVLPYRWVEICYARFGVAINDVKALSPTQFYVSNWQFYRVDNNKLMHYVEMFTQQPW